MLKKAWQHLHFPRLLKKKCADAKLQVAFHHSTLESILVYCVTLWCAGCSAADKKELSRGAGYKHSTKDHWLRSSLPKKQLHRRGYKIIPQHSSHPGHSPFDLLLSGRCYRSNRLKTVYCCTVVNKATHSRQSPHAQYFQLIDTEALCATYLCIYSYSLVSTECLFVLLCECFAAFCIVFLSEARERSSTPQFCCTVFAKYNDSKAILTLILQLDG